MVFIFLIGPCLLIIGVGCFALAIGTGGAIGLLSRSVLAGVLSGLLTLILAVPGGVHYFFQGFAGPQRQRSYTLYGENPLVASCEAAAWLGGAGLAIFLTALLIRLTTTAREHRHVAPAGSAFRCASCRGCLTEAEADVGMCAGCRRADRT